MPNRRLGKAWQATARIKTEQREAAYLCTMAALKLNGPQKWEGNIPLSLVFMPPDKRKRDLDGLVSAAKAEIDGMAQALGVDDSRFRPLLVDCVYCGGEGALVAAVGVEIVSGVSLC